MSIVKVHISPTIQLYPVQNNSIIIMWAKSKPVVTAFEFQVNLGHFPIKHLICSIQQMANNSGRHFNDDLCMNRNI